MSETPAYLREALEYLKKEGLEPEYGFIEITCDGLAAHMTMFHYQETIVLHQALKKLTEAASNIENDNNHIPKPLWDSLQEALTNAKSIS